MCPLMEGTHGLQLSWSPYRSGDTGSGLNPHNQLPYPLKKNFLYLTLVWLVDLLVKCAAGNEPMLSNLKSSASPCHIPASFTMLRAHSVLVQSMGMDIVARGGASSRGKG